ncbi:TetR/AcrR family transcriptional regulator [Ferrovibrio sp.]|uniref:TetR/AcrR family transcriptional regulator n=1 Tax=Ferrovibrio sp. TaxID=1917215 RepID=UPI000CAEC2C8|nr:TetR/AcrR family transcriptional regulator [Ferrovibrio sp.]PJI37559.1 MAG: TetR family transcriptional regulator [Ferrovibrio sp.]
MRPREFDQDAVLRIAFDQFWRKGVRGASLSDIAREAAVQRGSLYNAFGSKEALFLAAYDRYSGNYLVAVEKVLNGASLRDSLTTFFDMTIRNFRSGTPSRGCPTTRGLMELDTSAGDGVDEQARKTFAALVTRVTTLIEDAFSRAAARGEFSGDATAAAWQIATVTRGLAVLERAFDDEAQLRKIAGDTINLVLGDLPLGKAARPA